MNAVVTELVIDGRGAQSGSATYVQAMKAAQAAVDRFMDRQRAMDTAVVGTGATLERSATSTSAASRALDRLKASIDPTFASVKALERDIVTLDRAVTHLGVSEAEAARMLDAVRLKHDAVALAAKRQADEYLRLAAAGRAAFAADQNQRNFSAFMGVRDPSAFAGSARASAAVFEAQQASSIPGRGAGNFNSANAAFQVQDIAMMAAMGQAPLATGLQQGPQLAMVMQQGGGVAALGAGLASLVSPIMLVTVGMTTLTAAAIQWATSTTDSAETIEEALERQKTLLGDLERGYGRVAEKAREGFDSSSGDFALRLARSENELRLLLSSQSRALASPNSALGGFFSDPTALGITANFDPRTSRTTFGVRGEFAAFEEEILQLHGTIVAGTPDFLAFRRAITDRWNLDSNNEELTEQAKALLDLTESAADLETQYRRLKRAQDEFGRNVEPTTGLLRSSGSFAREDMGRLGSFRAAEEVARRRAEAVFEADMLELGARSPADRAAAARAAAAATYNDDESADARRQRIDLAGRRALAEAEHSLSEAQRERSRSLDATLAAQQLDLSLIGKTVGETERLRMEFELTQQVREEAARNNIAVDQRELDLIKEKAAAYGEVAEAIARTALREDIAFERAQFFRSPIDQQVAQRLRGSGLAVDLNSDEARMMRENLRFEERRDAIDGFFTDMRSAFLRNGGDIGDAFAEAFRNAAMRHLDKIAENAIDMLSSSLASLFGFGGSSSGSGGAGVVATGLVTRMFAPANQNSAPSGMVSGGVAAQAWNFFKSKGLADHQVAGILGNISAESAFNPSAVGDGGNAFGLFQHWPNRGGGRGMLGNTQAQLDLAWRELQTTESRAFQQLLSSRDVRGATAAFGGFERPSGFSWQNPEAMHNWSGRLDAAENALSKFGNTASGATQALGQFGGGLGGLAQALMNVGGGHGESGWFSGLMSMFGGAAGAIGHMNRISPLATAFIARGGVGLFAEGGVTDRPAIFGEVPGQLEAAVPLSRNRAIPVEIRMPTARASGGGAMGVHVTLGWEQGSNGNIEPVVRNVVQKEAPGIARQEAAGAVNSYSYRQRQGGAAADDHRFQRLKRRG